MIRKRNSINSASRGSMSKLARSPCIALFDISVAFEILPADADRSRCRPSTFSPAPTKSSKNTRRLPSRLAPERVATVFPNDLGSAGSAHQMMR